jgi:hypothetical protein
MDGGNPHGYVRHPCHTREISFGEMCSAANVLQAGSNRAELEQIVSTSHGAF